MDDNDFEQQQRNSENSKHYINCVFPCYVCISASDLLKELCKSGNKVCAKLLPNCVFVVDEADCSVGTLQHPSIFLIQTPESALLNAEGARFYCSSPSFNCHLMNCYRCAQWKMYTNGYTTLTATGK